jgi:hypothetical protein
MRIRWLSARREVRGWWFPSDVPCWSSSGVVSAVVLVGSEWLTMVVLKLTLGMKNLENSYHHLRLTMGTDPRPVHRARNAMFHSHHACLIPTCNSSDPAMRQAASRITNSPEIHGERQCEPVSA